VGYFVYYAVGYAAEYFIWDVRPVGRHEIDRSDSADGYKLIICAAVSHYADCLYAGQYGEELAHLVRIAAFVHFVAQHRVRVLQYAHLLGRDFAYYAHAKAGAGTLVPITGFANSVVSPAVEFKAEGWITGVGAKIFTIAGPVLAFGTLASWVWGLVYWAMNKF